MKQLSIVIVVILSIAFFNGLFVVNETETVVITQFGKPVRTVYNPGLNFKIPFLQNIQFFDKRILSWDGYPNQIPTKDKKYIWLDTTARWRIKDPLTFLETVQNEYGAQSRLDDIIDAVARDQITKLQLIEIIRSTNREMKTEVGNIFQDQTDTASIQVGREKLTQLILEKANTYVKQYGIELIDVRIKRVNYIEKVREEVYARMRAEREQKSQKYRSEGEGEEAKILGLMEKELKRIKSEGYRDAQKIKGQADAEVTKIYADAFSKDPEFYSFLRSLEIYEKQFNNKTHLYLSTDNELLRYLKNYK